MVIHPFQLKLLEPIVIVTVSISIRKAFVWTARILTAGYSNGSKFH